MLRHLKTLKGSTVYSNEDREIGTIKDFYFDEREWGIRYLVIDTGGLLSQNLIVLSPHSVEEVMWGAFNLKTNIPFAKIESFPSADLEKPLSKLEEEKLSNYYGWPMYWSYSPSMWGYSAFPYAHITGAEQTERIQNEDKRIDDKIKKTHLRSYNEVIGYKMNASGERFGNVEDLIIEDESFTIRLLVIDTVSFWPSKSVLISPTWINDINWASREIRTSLAADAIKKAPAYDRSGPVNRTYEKQLYQAYHQVPYWQEEDENSDVEGFIPGIKKYIDKGQDTQNK